MEFDNEASTEEHIHIKHQQFRPVDKLNVSSSENIESSANKLLMSRTISVPRKKPQIHVDVIDGGVTEPEVVERWRKATEILLRALQRRDEATKKANGDQGNDGSGG